MESEIRWPDPDGDWLIVLRWETVRGRPEAVSVTVTSTTGQRVTTSLLRSIPLASVIDRARADLVGSQNSATKAERIEEPTGHGGRPRLTDDHFKQVAAIYQEAHAGLFHDGRSPLNAIAHTFEVSKSTAAKWAARARELGYLGETSKGRPSPPPDTTKGNE